MSARTLLSSTQLDVVSSLADDLISDIDGALHVALSIVGDDGLATAFSTCEAVDVERDGNGPTTAVVRLGRIVRLPTVERLDEFPEYARSCRSVGVASVACFPVKRDGDVVAVLTVTSVDHHGFGAADVRTGRRCAEAVGHLIAP